MSLPYFEPVYNPRPGCKCVITPILYYPIVVIRAAVVRGVGGVFVFQLTFRLCLKYDAFVCGREIEISRLYISNDSGFMTFLFYF
jgi:hypothetical protein